MPAHLEKPTAHPHVAVVTIDRPGSANALDPETLCDLARHWQAINDDDEVRAAILTGSGEQAFCSGMDMKRTIPASQALARGERIDPADFEGLRAVGRATLVDLRLRVPLIAAVNGHARAGGFDLMLASQIRIAVPEASFALEEVALGLYPTGHATVLLPRQIPAVHAHALLLTSAPIDAARALEVGLINEISDPARLMDRAFETADRIAANAPLAVQATLAGLRELEAMPLDQAYARQEALGRPLRRSKDAREAQSAFLERRPARFTGE